MLSKIVSENCSNFRCLMQSDQKSKKPFWRKRSFWGLRVQNTVGKDDTMHNTMLLLRIQPKIKDSTSLLISGFFFQQYNSIIHIVSNSKVHITNINYTMDNHRSSSSTDHNMAYHHCYGIIQIHLEHTGIESEYGLEIGLLGPEWHNLQSNGPNLYFSKACKQNIACAQS